MKPKPKQPVMTIAIGFACKDGIVVASDSQMSTGTKYKQPNEPKIGVLKFSGDQYAILAIAGSLAGARCFQQILEIDTVSLKITDERSIANCAESALKKTRSKMLDYADHPSLAGDGKQAHLDQLDFEVLLAYYFDGKPFIYGLSLSNGIAIRGRHPYEAIGCGSDVAGVILTGADFSSYLTEEAIGLAFYTIEACKKFDQACGGPIQHLILDASGKHAPAPLSKQKSDWYEEAVRKIDQDTQLLISQSIYAAVQEAYFKVVQDLI